MSNETPKINKTCKRCAIKKKKCDSTKPSCKRCLRNNASCVYERSKKPGKKRALVTKSTQQLKKLNFTETEKNILFNLLQPRIISSKQLLKVFSRFAQSENKTWKVIENCSSVLAAEANSHSLVNLPSAQFVAGAYMLFTVQMLLTNKLSFNTEAEDQFYLFNKIATDHRLNLEHIGSTLQTFVSLPDEKYTEEKKTEFYSSLDLYQQQLKQNVLSRKGFCRIVSNQDSIKFSGRATPKFEVNDAFREYFGFDDTEMGESVQCLLQFGGSVISLLATEQDLHNFLQANFNQIEQMDLVQKSNATQTWDLTIPISVILMLQMGSGECKPFKVEALTREVLTKNYYFGEVRLYFTPCDIQLP
eukprot:snap_masked-scaffold_38-processed-gene-1.42-mRNA-1 protein AED:1.00 eAED:1.00 QI:0/0/0/0/1/1/2/0/359